MKKLMMFMVTLLTVVLTAGCSKTTNSTLKAQETTTTEESTTLQNVKALPMLSKFLTGVTSSVSSENTETTEEEIPFEDKDGVRKKIQKSGLENWDKINKEVLSFRASDAFKYKPQGHYYLDRWYVKVYSFEAPNNFYSAVMLNNEESSVMLIHNTGSVGISFADVLSVTPGKFYGLTSQHIIFQEENKSLTAIPVDGDNTWYDESNSLKFSELSGVERKTLIKPISSCRYNFSEPKNSEK